LVEMIKSLFAIFLPLCMAEGSFLLE